jgi:hypothetical protein
MKKFVFAFGLLLLAGCPQPQPIIVNEPPPRDRVIVEHHRPPVIVEPRREIIVEPRREIIVAPPPHHAPPVVRPRVDVDITIPLRTENPEKK